MMEPNHADIALDVAQERSAETENDGVHRARGDDQAAAA
jgi:hypothetical protein